MGFIIRGGGTSGGSGGTTDHNALVNKNLPNQHTINAIQGLQSELDKKVSVIIGKSLSTNDYDNTAKNKVDNLNITQVVDLDAVESASHTHTNSSVLGKIGESAGGNITYNGVEINSSGGGISYQQVTKLSAAANDVVEIPITTTTTFALPPVEVLKFTAGSQNQILTSCEFNLADASKFSVEGITNSPYIVFDGNMYLNTNYSFPMVIKTGWTASGQYSEDTNIDDTKFKIIAGVTII